MIRVTRAESIQLAPSVHSTHPATLSKMAATAQLQPEDDGHMSSPSPSPSCVTLALPWPQVAAPKIMYQCSRTCSLIIPPAQRLSPFNLDLTERSRRLVADVPNATPGPALAALANGQAAPASQLFAELAGLASVAGEPVTKRFAPLALDILARWLDDAPAAAVWEARLAVLASLAEPRPDLWP